MLKLIITDMKNPHLFKVFGVLHSELGVPLPAPGHIIVPGECAPCLVELEASAACLHTSLPALEDADAYEAIAQGEAPRYVDCELASFVCGDPEVASGIASRIPNGSRLLAAVDCMREYLSGDRL